MQKQNISQALEITTWVLRYVFMKCIKQKYYYEAEACNFTKNDRFFKSIF